MESPLLGDGALHDSVTITGKVIAPVAKGGVGAVHLHADVGRDGESSGSSRLSNGSSRHCVKEIGLFQGR